MGVIIAASLMFYHVFIVPIQKNLDINLSEGKVLMSSAVILGGAISGLIIEKYLRTRFTKLGGIWGGTIGGILISPIALFFGITFGGTIGVSYGSLMGSELGNCNIGSYAGAFTAISSVIIFIEFISAVICAILGMFLQSLLHRFLPHIKR